MENKIPTAEELLSNNIDGLREVVKDDDIFFFYKDVIKNYAIEFAQMHVKAALGAAYKNADTKEEEKGDEPICWSEDQMRGVWVLDKNSIIDAYPLENIK